MNSKPPTTELSNESVWATTTKPPEFDLLAQNVQTDVCIVGAGIAGLTTGLLLIAAGKRVVILDDGPLAGGMTQVTTAHLSNVIDDRFINIERWHGEAGLRLAAQSHAAAIDRIESIATALKVNCDFQRLDGYLFRAPDDGEDSDLLDRELAAAHRAGLLDAEIVIDTPIHSLAAGPLIRFPNQARFHPLKYLGAVARAIQARGGQIFTHSHADKIEGGTPARIQVRNHRITADAVVVATNSPINDLVAIHTKQAPYMTYVIGAKVPRGSITDALYWDTLSAYHYVRLQPMGEYDLLIVGGEDHKTGQAAEGHDPHGNLISWVRHHFPAIEEIEFTWGGQCMETIDGLAFIGRNPLDKENVFIATGDSGMGITHGTIAGMLLSDLILERENPWATLYDPARKTLRAAGTFLKENLNVASQYVDWVTGGEVNSIEEISEANGAILRRGLSKVAVYRDAQGEARELSAVCPHLGCVVTWNEVEKSWDCPCHGSRFRPEGEVINGPANIPLAPFS